MDEDFQREIKTDPKSVSSHHPVWVCDFGSDMDKPGHWVKCL